MAKQPLDLYKLFKLVVERGGLVEVCYYSAICTITTTFLCVLSFPCFYSFCS